LYAPDQRMSTRSAPSSHPFTQASPACPPTAV